MEINKMIDSYCDKSNDAINLSLNFLKDKYSKNDYLVIKKELLKISFGSESEYNSNFDSFKQLQENLSTINEKSNGRKVKGVYYTPSDLVNYIVINSVKLWNKKLNSMNLHVNNLNGIPYIKTCFKANVFDPTCGLGEFILGALSIKFDLLEMHREKVSKKDIFKIVKTIHGNDISLESVKITKIRIVLFVLERYGPENIEGIVEILDNNFMQCDFILENKKETYDIIIGNPPYVEDNKSGLELKVRYGNIYANVLDNSSKILNQNGVMGFVIPISYVSTPRMTPVRELMSERMPKHFILSFADRPDSLFSAAHQKLCVCLFSKAEGKKELYTSSYAYWYKSERRELFENLTVVKNRYEESRYIPKLGNKESLSIYKKVTEGDQFLFDRLNEVIGENIYLNMRAAFWIKVFDFPQSSSEYKKYVCDKKNVDYIYCLLNSSLFWWYWICISDCWHITQKELRTFIIKDYKKYNNTLKSLAKKLKLELEETKVYVGTRQTDYEYKHKDCINIIHNIDDVINKIYGLNDRESTYVKNFALRYRIGGELI